jgi:SAM-dependent methyltransferase
MASMSDPSPAAERPNAAMADNWNGVGGEHWVAHTDRHDRALQAYGRAVLDAAAIRPADRVLDVGCGTGWLSRAAARHAAEGSVLGLDIGRPMVEAARAIAEREGPGNVRFDQADAQVHPFDPGAADVVISRFGVMFFDDPVAAFANLRAAVADDGRIAFVCWQSLLANDWLLVPGGALAAHLGMPEADDPQAPGPFSLAEPDHVRAVLHAAGFADVTLAEEAHPMWLGTDADDAFGYMRNNSIARTMIDGKPPELVERALAALRATLEDIAGPDGIQLPGRAWLVTATAA